MGTIYFFLLIFLSCIGSWSKLWASLCPIYSLLPLGRFGLARQMDMFVSTLSLLHLGVSLRLTLLVLAVSWCNPPEKPSLLVNTCPHLPNSGVTLEALMGKKNPTNWDFLKIHNLCQKASSNPSSWPCHLWYILIIIMSFQFLISGIF